MMAKTKLLLVTSDPLLTRACQIRFGREGFDVEHYGTSYEGLKRLHEWLPELMLLDVVLPGRDGLEMLKGLREVPWVVKTKVVMLVDHTLQSEILQECLAWGAEGHVPKDVWSLEAVVTYLKKLVPSPAG